MGGKKEEVVVGCMTGGLIHLKETKVKPIVGEIKILLHYKLAITTQHRDVGDTDTPESSVET